MSALTPLSEWKLFRSHLVNCPQCKRYKGGRKNQAGGTKLCRVGSILLSKALATKEKEPSQKAKSFPFVAKINERVKILVSGKWVEAYVRDRSIQPSEMYQYEDYKTHEVTWRTSAPKIVGYEVETDDKDRHYVRPNEIQPLVRKVRRVETQAAVDSVITKLRGLI